MKKLAFVLLFAVGCGECTVERAAQIKTGGMCFGSDRDLGAVCLVFTTGATIVHQCTITGNGLVGFEADTCRPIGTLKGE